MTFVTGSITWACEQHNSTACECALANFVDEWELRQEMEAWERLSEEGLRRLEDDIDRLDEP